MHILIIPSYYPSREAPITGIFFHEQAVALHKAGHKVGVLVTPRLNVTLAAARRHGWTSLRATLREDDMFPDFPVYRMHWGWFPRFFPPAVALILDRAGIRAFDLYSREQGKPDVIHGHNIFYGGYLASRLGKRYGIPAVLTEYSSSFLEGLIIFPGQPRVIRQTLRASQAVWTCGSSLINPLHDYVPEQRLGTLGCIIDTEFFVPSSHPPPARPFKFVVIAQLKERRKGFDVLLKAFAKVFGGQSEILLLIRGQGPLRPELDALIAELDIGDQVQFLPMMSKAELRNLLQESHCLVSSSYIETFGVSVAEAIACGTPVISTTSGGPEDFVTERSGILVPPGNVEALADAMQRMVATRDKYNPDEVRRDVSERYGERVYVNKLEAIYGSAISTYSGV